MGDKIIKGLLCDAAVNFYAITARNLAESARIMHGASPTCTAVLGQVPHGGLHDGLHDEKRRG